MAYVINVFVAQIPTLAQIAASYPNAVVIPLQQGFGLIPITSAFRQQVHLQNAEPLHEFYGLTASLAEIGIAASQSSALAYVEAEIFGGSGTQAAVAWYQGQVIAEPLISEEIPVINRVLHKLGVQTGAAADEFAALELGKYRHTEDWLRDAQA